MIELAEQFLAWTQANPGWALLILLVVAAFDAAFVVGVFVPAGPVLFVIGALVALDVVNFWTAVGVAAAGALVGDFSAFWIGRHYRERLFQIRWLQKRRGLIDNAQQFFSRHGGKGVLIARFLGPLRAFLPAVAGASGMRPGFFLLVDSFAVVAWAIVFILPGVVLGASLGLAAEVAGRFALLLALTGLLAWGSFTLTRWCVLRVSQQGEHWLGRLLTRSRRYRRLGVFGPALADPQQPETPVLAALSLVLWAFGSLVLFLLAAPVLHSHPWPVDAAIFQWLRELHTPYGIAAATAFLHMGEWSVYLPVALALLLGLALNPAPRAAAHWLAALLFGGGLALGLALVPTLPAPYEYFELHAPPGHAQRDLIMATVLYGFLPVLLGTGRSARLRSFYYGLSATLLSLIVASRLYLGGHWASHALVEVGIGLFWVALLGLGFRSHAPVALRFTHSLVPVALAFTLATAWTWARDESFLPDETPALQRSDLDLQRWLDEGWAELPKVRIDMAGRSRAPLNLQWAGDLPTIRQQLLDTGWSEPPGLGGGQLLRWLSSSVPIELLPVLPHVHAGEPQALALRRLIDDQHQYLLRLWPSGLRLADGTPLWIGSLSLQEARPAYGGLMRYPIAVRRAAGTEVLAPFEPLSRRDGRLQLLSSPNRSADAHER